MEGEQVAVANDLARLQGSTSTCSGSRFSFDNKLGTQHIQTGRYRLEYADYVTCKFRRISSVRSMMQFVGRTKILSAESFGAICDCVCFDCNKLLLCHRRHVIGGNVLEFISLMHRKKLPVYAVDNAGEYYYSDYDISVEQFGSRNRVFIVAIS